MADYHREGTCEQDFDTLGFVLTNRLNNTYKGRPAFDRARESVNRCINERTLTANDAQHIYVIGELKKLLKYIDQIEEGELIENITWYRSHFYAGQVEITGGSKKRKTRKRKMKGRRKTGRRL